MIHIIISFSCSSNFFSRHSFIIKDNANNGRNPAFYPFPALMTPFPDMASINEEATGCINEEAISAISEAAIHAIITPRSPHSCFSGTIN